MTLTQCFPLRNSGPSSTVKLKMALRVRCELGCMTDAKGAQTDQDFRPLEGFQKQPQLICSFLELDDTYRCGCELQLV